MASMPPCCRYRLMLARSVGYTIIPTSVCDRSVACLHQTSSITLTRRRYGTNIRKAWLLDMTVTVIFFNFICCVLQNITFLRDVAYPFLYAVGDFYLSYVTPDENGTFHVLNACAQVRASWWLSCLHDNASCSFKGSYIFFMNFSMFFWKGDMRWKYGRSGKWWYSRSCLCTAGRLRCYVQDTVGFVQKYIDSKSKCGQRYAATMYATYWLALRSLLRWFGWALS